MIRRLLTVTIVLATIFGLVAPAEAAKGAKKKGGKNATGRALARFDRDHNGTIDGTEAERVRSAFTALYALDSNKDGQLTDSEIAATPVAQGKKKKKK